MGSYKEKHGKTRVGAWLADKAPNILNKIGGVLPDAGALGVVKNLITTDTELSEADKQEALQLLEYDLKEAEEVTKRWQSDSTSDSYLSKNVRPMSFISMIAATFVFTLLDLMGSIEVREIWITLYKDILMLMVFAYFGGRTFEKVKKIQK